MEALKCSNAATVNIPNSAVSKASSPTKWNDANAPD